MKNISSIWLDVLSRSRLRVLLSINSEDGNPARANIKQALDNELTGAFGKPFEVLNNIFEHWVFNSLVHSFRALSALRRSGLRTASTAAKPCQGDSSEFYLITGSIYTDQRGTVVLATLFNGSEQRHYPHTKLTREGLYTCNVCVEYEWKPSRCACCKVFGHVLDEFPNNIDSNVVKNMKKPSKTPRGVSPTTKVSNSNLFDVLNLVENDVDLGTNGGSPRNMEYSMTSNTPIVDKFDKTERLIIEGKVTLVHDEGKPLKKVDYLGDHDSEDEFALTNNDTTNFLAAKKDGYGNNSGLEQWKESYMNGDYDFDPYDDDMYEGQDILDKIQAIYDNFDITVRVVDRWKGITDRHDTSVECFYYETQGHVTIVCELQRHQDGQDVNAKGKGYCSTQILFTHSKQEIQVLFWIDVSFQKSKQDLNNACCDSIVRNPKLGIQKA
uniref:Uncharacterized protein n=1 Tax=Tanacetum cinerariifolium TaxID=118510 RepID=A0A699HFB9_TANCI|nr:hypothetical protein [Tanacetum cinerariifolium]